MKFILTNATSPELEFEALEPRNVTAMPRRIFEMERVSATFCLVLVSIGSSSRGWTCSVVTAIRRLHMKCSMGRTNMLGSHALLLHEHLGILRIPLTFLARGQGINYHNSVARGC